MNKELLRQKFLDRMNSRSDEERLSLLRDIEPSIVGRALTYERMFHIIDNQTCAGTPVLWVCNDFLSESKERYEHTSNNMSFYSKKFEVLVQKVMNETKHNYSFEPLEYQLQMLTYSPLKSFENESIRSLKKNENIDVFTAFFTADGRLINTQEVRV